MDPGSPSKAELLKLLDEANRRVEEEKIRAEEEKIRAEEEKIRADQANRRAEEEQARADGFAGQVQKTTFMEFLETCHYSISVPLAIQTDKSLTTKGSIPAPTGRFCPTSLEPWDFHAAQQSLFDKVYEFFHPSHRSALRLFPAIPIIEDRGHHACSRPLGSENDLQRHQYNEVEIPVEEIIEKLATIPEAKLEFSLGDGIMFENHLNTITEQPGGDEPLNTRVVKPDQNCIFRRVDEERQLIYVTEYKAGHKLTDAFLRAGLRPMNMYKEVVQRILIPNDLDEKLKYDAEQVTCASLVQTYDYMIKQGLEYSCLTNGRIKVMLRVPENNETTLQYCLLEPGRDAEPGDDRDGFRFPYTAIGCYLGLTLLALGSTPRNQTWRNSAQEKAHIWEVDFENVLQQIPTTERKAIPSSPPYEPPRYPLNDRSPYLLRNRKARPIFGPDTEITVAHNSDPSSSEDEVGDREPPSSPLQSIERRKRQRTSTTNKRPSGSAEQTNRQSHQYCTQKCLGGLFSRSPFDPNCPNNHLHKNYSKHGSHPISLQKLVSLMEKQVNEDPDCCRYLKIGGLHGSLFALSLQGYGYTFVGKGTPYNSKHEAGVYERLRPLQGNTVPVYLGDIYLRKSKYFLLDRTIIQMSLMAWGGKSLQDITPLTEKAGLEERVKQARADLLLYGVEHLDFEKRNLLWSEEVQGVMVIDFGRVKIHKSTKRKHATVLANFSPNPKRRKAQEPDTNTVVKTLQSEERLEPVVSQEEPESLEYL
ncbi:hypothetical protein ACJ72_04641 [Emergomyces africanus]|uniref:Protein kinase domain-containing protein n=1 Tax=Emergomyces africanus TaxID=1955775 RepID=A0A1B7NW80_9EURO|nr:hypothetical protein ACJ72_04641 [Emergomyces africanus]